MLGLNNTTVERVTPLLAPVLMPEMAVAQKQLESLKAAVEASQSAIMRCFIINYFNDDRNLIDMQKFLTAVKTRCDDRGSLMAGGCGAPCD